MRLTINTYRHLAEDIERQITLGIYRPGSKIPPYRQLAGIYHVHPSTVQRAIQFLRWKGVVVGSQGRGVFVAEAALNHRPTPTDPDRT